MTGEPLQNEFHDHLDICKQCREHPMDLCMVGAVLLRKEATKCTEDMERMFPQFAEPEARREAGPHIY